MSLSLIKSALQSLAKIQDSQKAKRFFKTSPGDYAEGDIFIGVSVPELRKLAKEFKNLPQTDIATLLSSKTNEERLLALLILVLQFSKNPEGTYEFYLKHLRYVNNWNLVDQSAPYILGAFLLEKDRKILYHLARSDNLWEKRVAIIACWWFIRKNDFKDAISIVTMLLSDKHDLIHKATGWMLREIGRRDEPQLRQFLDQYRASMPRTTLRAAIERFSAEDRVKYLARNINNS